MAIELLPTPVETDGNDGPELTHVFCHNEDIALCGEDVSGYTMVDEAPEASQECVVCFDLEFSAQPCCPWAP